MIPKEDIQKIAELSRIKLTETEIESLQKDISGILDYVGQLRRYEVGVPTEASGVSIPLNHNVMREDVPYGNDSALKAARGDIIAAFPRKEGDYDVVRKIIQKDE